MTAPANEGLRVWREVDPAGGKDLVDARLQLHHAAQLATAFGISYLPAQPDDSHTNLEWIGSLGALASKPSGSASIRVAVRPNPFAILILDAKASALATYSLDGRVIGDAAQWVRSQLATHGFDGGRYTLERHYEIPKHRVDDGAAFESSTSASAFKTLASWYADAAAALEYVRATTPNASPVRCWPHHFDIATLIQVAPGKMISLGMEPGDDDYPEPYFYASVYPSPSSDAPRDDLAGNGMWHTRDWIGAVLPASRLCETGQQSQTNEFISSAVRACKKLLVDS
jgi:hypothetical protein